jgi:hypothetical protein
LDWKLNEGVVDYEYELNLDEFMEVKIYSSDEENMAPHCLPNIRLSEGTPDFVMLSLSESDGKLRIIPTALLQVGVYEFRI